MSKRVVDPAAQLSFDLTQASAVTPTHGSRICTVVSFVDASTLAARRAALARVRASGIFPVPGRVRLEG